MNITFLIGNGFDLNLGIETRYNQFYEYVKIEETTAVKNQIRNLI